LKLFVKSGKNNIGTLVWSQKGLDFKKKEKRGHWASTRHETQFNNKFGVKLSLPCPFFS